MLYHVLQKSNDFKFERFESKVQKCFDANNFYEAHQMYKSFFYRMLNQKKYEELENVLYDGIFRLLKANEVSSAVDLAEAFIEVLNKSRAPVSAIVLNRIEQFQIFSQLPSSIGKGAGATVGNSSRVDRRNQFLTLALKWSMEVSQKKRYKDKGHGALHRVFAVVLWHEGNYCSARNHFILSDDSEIFAKFLIEFQQKFGFNTERDLFIAQAVLQLLCYRRPKTASNLFHSYCLQHPKISENPPYSLPLLNFVWFLTLCIQVKKLQYFTLVMEQYHFLIDCDPDYRVYLRKISEIYFGLPTGNQDGGGLLSNIIKGLLGSDKTETSPNSQQEVSDSEDEFFESQSEFETPASSFKSSPPGPSGILKGNIENSDGMELD